MWVFFLAKFACSLMLAVSRVWGDFSPVVASDPTPSGNNIISTYWWRENVGHIGSRSFSLSFLFPYLLSVWEAKWLKVKRIPHNNNTTKMVSSLLYRVADRFVISKGINGYREKTGHWGWEGKINQPWSNGRAESMGRILLRCLLNFLTCDFPKHSVSIPNFFRLALMVSSQCFLWPLQFLWPRLNLE